MATPDISERPWSAYTESDYTLQQWHNACLIHLHMGPPTSKTQCKLPVKTPNGVLNRNGVHAAAAALAGARATLQAPVELKTKAAAALRRHYSRLGEDPPSSLMMQSGFDVADDILAHHGVKGMKWGVRNTRELAGDILLERGLAISTTGSRARGAARAANRASAPVKVTTKGKKLKTSGGKARPAHSDAVRAHTLKQVSKKSGVHALSNDELHALTRRLQLEQSLRQLNSNQKSTGEKFARGAVNKVGNKAVDEVLNASTASVKKTIYRLLN
jgi:hypothetical protein